MGDLKLIIAKNITELRHKYNYTQAELAEKLNYSDKAVSKWERGESVPDIAVLKSIADMFGVKVDYLLKEEHTDVSDEINHISRRRLRNHMIITGMCILLVWLIATFIFVNIDLVVSGLKGHWLAFVYAVPVSMIVWLVFNSLWFKQHRNFLIISLLMWSSLITVFLTFIFLQHNYWQIFLIGIPAQAIILLWSGIRSRSKNSKSL